MKIYRTTLSELRKVLKKYNVKQRTFKAAQKFKPWDFIRHNTKTGPSWAGWISPDGFNYPGDLSIIGLDAEFRGSANPINYELSEPTEGETQYFLKRAGDRARWESEWHGGKSGDVLRELISRLSGKESIKEVKGNPKIYGVGEQSGHGELLVVCMGFKPKLPKELRDEMFVDTIDKWGYGTDISIDDLPKEDIIRTEKEFNVWTEEIVGEYVDTGKESGKEKNSKTEQIAISNKISKDLNVIGIKHTIVDRGKGDAVIIKLDLTNLRDQKLEKYLKSNGYSWQINKWTGNKWEIIIDEHVVYVWIADNKRGKNIEFSIFSSLLF
jgi:hypothetical protein